MFLESFLIRHLGQVPQGDGAHQSHQPEHVPAVPAETQDAETVRQCDEGQEEEEGGRRGKSARARGGARSQYTPVQTAVRQPLLMAARPATTIAMAGSQYRNETLHRLDKMSRDSQVVVLDSTLFGRCIQVYSKIWSTVQSQAQFRPDYAELGSNPIGRSSGERYELTTQLDLPLIRSIGS
jgi:hypothetical protein